MNEWENPPVPRNFWKLKKNRLSYLVWLGGKLNFQKTEDWYNISTEHFYNFNGKGLLHIYYNGSKILALKELYPNFEWKEWLFNLTSSGYWRIKKNRLAYMLWISNKYKIKNPEEWYKITYKHFEESPKGESFLQYFDSSPILAIKEYLPDYEWKEWLFASPSKNFWNNRKNVKDYFDWIEKKLEYKKPKDWYTISQNTLKKYNGWTIIKKGIANTLIETYPNYGLIPWKFKSVGNNFWKYKNNRIDYIFWLKKRLKIKNIKEWYDVSVNDFIRNYGSGILDYKKNYSSAIIEAYPKYNWQKQNFFKGLKNQKKLFFLIKKIYPKKKVIWNYKSNLLFKKSKKYMEIDIFLPEMNIGFEYQGEQHYRPIPLFGGIKGFNDTLKRDNEKKIAFKKAGIIVYFVPYYLEKNLNNIKKFIRTN